MNFVQPIRDPERISPFGYLILRILNRLILII